VDSANFVRSLHLDGLLVFSTYGKGQGSEIVTTMERGTGGAAFFRWCVPQGLGSSVFLARSTATTEKPITRTLHIGVHLSGGMQSARANLDSLPETTILIDAGEDVFAVWRLSSPVAGPKLFDLANAVAASAGGRAAFFIPVPGTVRKGKRVTEVWFKKHLTYSPDDLVEGAAPSAPLQRADQITAPKMAWLWPSMIPLGQLTMLAGEPKIGKSQIAIDIAARVTRGDGWPDGSGGSAPGGVAILETEDLLGETLGRIEAAGGIMSRMLVSDKHRDLSTKEGVANLERELSAVENPRALILSPVRMFFGKETAAQVKMRNILMPLLDMVQRRNIALIGVAHKEAGKKGRSTEEIAGPKVFTQRARAALTALADTRDPVYQENPKLARRILVSAGGNNSPDGFELAYRCEGFTCADGSPSVRVVWSHEKRSLLALPAPFTREAAREWLRSELSKGPRLAAEIRATANEAGISVATLQRARSDIGVVTSSRDGFGGGVTWMLP
jgi:putative DNA primase/helicase